MKTLLFIDGCVRGGASRTLALTERFLDRWRAKNPDWAVERLTLDAMGLRPRTGAEIERLGTLEREKSFDGPDFALARQFAAADKILLAAPFWELSFPAAVKVYLEHVSVVGIAFRYGADGETIGMCRADKLLFVTTRGGNYDGSEFECGWRQIVGLCGMYGIGEPLLLRAEGLDDVRNDAGALLARAGEEADALAETF
ncbi:FMN-dependent NADH-azoreductase 2 [Oscillospiraceae bacterium]|nr:FMN-dependent NADH-azoreductase 2 [Oscillospiraceae bacterium]